MTNKFDRKDIIEEGDYVVWIYKENFDLWQVEEVGWCGGYAIALVKDSTVRFVVDPKDIRLADSSEINSKEKFFITDEYKPGDRVVLSFDKDQRDTSIYEILNLVVDEEFAQNIILHNVKTGAQLRVHEKEIRLATPDELKYEMRVWC